MESDGALLRVGGGDERSQDEGLVEEEEAEREGRGVRRICTV